MAQVTIVVRDQDEALRFYVDELGFEKREDMTLGGFQWLTVAPQGQKDLAIVLEKPTLEMDLAGRNSSPRSSASRRHGCSTLPTATPRTRR